jgi:predicted aspartyl protease
VHVKAKVVIRGSKGSAELTALVDAGSSMTVVDRGLAEAIGVEYTDRERVIVTASGQEIVSKVAIVKELIVEDEPLKFERVLVMDFSENVKEGLKNLGVSDSMVLGMATLESAGFMPDTTTGKLRRIKLLLI